MTALFSSVVQYLTGHPHIAYLAVFLLALSEAVPVAGVVVPGSAIILAVSALVPSGVLLLWPLLAAAALGAIAGDGLSFWLGHRFQREILGFWPLNRFTEVISRSERFFARHGDKSVFLARFMPGVRAFVPLLAGSLGMSARRFYTANIVSALVWAPLHVLPGVLVGATLGILGAAVKPLAVLLVLLAAMGWLAIHTVRYALRRGVPLLVSGSQHLRDWVASRDSPMSRRLLNLLDPSRHEARALLMLGVLLIGAAWLFFGVLEDVLSGDQLVAADTSIYRALQDLRTPIGDAVMIVTTEIGDTAVVLPVTIVVLLWLGWKRAYRAAAYWILAVAGASALNTAIKVALHRARPGELLYPGWSAFSFPSGHSTVNVVLYGFFAFLVARELRPVWRPVIAAGVASVVLMIVISRLYLGAHWLSDAVGGVAFGTVWLAILGLSYFQRKPEPLEARKLLIVGFAALLLAGGFNIYRHHAFDIERYAVKETVPSMAAADWWKDGWQSLPARRVDLAGENEEPLTLQYAGDLQELQDALQRNGWHTSPAWTPVSALSWLTAKPDPNNLPAMPYPAGGRLPELTLVRLANVGAQNGMRLVLRVWASGFQLTNGTAEPLWIGSVVQERIDHPLSLFTVASAQEDANAPREALAGDLNDGRLSRRADGSTDENWDGRVLLAGGKARYER